MNRLLLGLLLFFLLLISNSSGCSIASVERAHLVTLLPLLNPDEYAVDVLDENGLMGSILLDLEDESVKPLEGITEINEPFYHSTHQNYDIELFQNESTLYLTVHDKTGWFFLNMSMGVEGGTLNDEWLFHFMVSETLQLAYLIFPYDFYQNPIEASLYADNSSIFIIPLANPENYTFTYSIYSYYFWNDFTSVYDEYQVVQSYGQGADCVGGIYLRYTETGFEHLFSSFAGESSFARLDQEKFITISSAWNGDYDSIKVINWQGETIKSFAISVNEMENALNRQETSNLKLPFFELFAAVNALIMIIWVRKRYYKDQSLL